MNIAVAGTGYVGMSIATLLAQHNHVTAVDVIPEKVEKINNKISPIQDDYIEKYLAEKQLDLTATLDGKEAYRDADYVVIAAPTNYDPQKNFFDTHHIEDVIDLVLSVNPDAVMVIKSTIPVGYCRSLYVKYALKFLTDPALKGKKFNLLFSPEFLRESKALYDNLYPSRIIVGYPKILPADRNAKWDEENAAIAAIGCLTAIGNDSTATDDVERVACCQFDTGTGTLLSAGGGSIAGNRNACGNKEIHCALDGQTTLSCVGISETEVVVPDAIVLSSTFHTKHLSCSGAGSDAFPLR